MPVAFKSKWYDWQPCDSGRVEYEPSKPSKGSPELAFEPFEGSGVGSQPKARLDLGDALALLDTATRERVVVGYEAGALPWALANLPDLQHRFHEAEAALGSLATISGGPQAAAWLAAIECWVALWAEISERYRRHQTWLGVRDL